MTVEATEPWWPLTAVEAWILARDHSAVAALCRPLTAIEKGEIFLRLSRNSGKSPQTARRELIDALAAAELTAYGDRGNGNGLQTIPAVEWSSLGYLYEDGRDRAGPYRNVVIHRAEVLRGWAEPAARRNVITGDQKAMAAARAKKLVKDDLAGATKAGDFRPSQRATLRALKDQGLPRKYLLAAHREICSEQD